MKRLGIFMFMLTSLLIWYYTTHPLVSKVKIGSNIITVEVAVSEGQKQKGLGGRASLALDRGMLFPYDHKEQYEFWMRGMQFPLDFIWIDGNTIVDITKNVPNPKNGEVPRIVKPKVQVDRILELNAGSTARIGINVGDTVEYIDR